MANKLNARELEFLNKNANKEYNHLKAGGYRLGQAYFNCLCDLNMELAKSITNTENDPYYEDSKISQFLEFIKGD